MDIGQVARASGVPASTLRYYEEKGLIASSGRRGLRRVFNPAVLERLAADGQPRIDRQRLAAKADELDRAIRKMSAMRDGLRHAAACPAPSHLECPTFRRLVRAAGAGAIGPRKRKLR